MHETVHSDDCLYVHRLARGRVCHAFTHSHSNAGSSATHRDFATSADSHTDSSAAHRHFATHSGADIGSSATHRDLATNIDSHTAAAAHLPGVPGREILSRA